MTENAENAEFYASVRSLFIEGRTRDTKAVGDPPNFSMEASAVDIAKTMTRFAPFMRRFGCGFVVQYKGFIGRVTTVDAVGIRIAHLNGPAAGGWEWLLNVDGLS